MCRGSLNTVAGSWGQNRCQLISPQKGRAADLKTHWFNNSRLMTLFKHLITPIDLIILLYTYICMRLSSQTSHFHLYSLVNIWCHSIYNTIWVEVTNSSINLCANKLLTEALNFSQIIDNMDALTSKAVIIRSYVHTTDLIITWIVISAFLFNKVTCKNFSENKKGKCIQGYSYYGFYCGYVIYKAGFSQLNHFISIEISI